MTDNVYRSTELCDCHNMPKGNCPVRLRSRGRKAVVRVEPQAPAIPEEVSDEIVPATGRHRDRRPRLEQCLDPSGKRARDRRRGRT